MSDQPSYKIPAKEMIMTRRKSAQLQRQLRDKDRSMKQITQLLQRKPKSDLPKVVSKKEKSISPLKVKTPKNNSKKVDEKNKSLLKKGEKKVPVLNVLNLEEYYPFKKKRQIVNKKTVLKKKCQLKKLCGLNKRKLTSPRRVSESPIPIKNNSQVNSENTMETNTAEDFDTQSLTDEDFLEILTCPSPVWWEDPPDGYVEDPIPRNIVNKFKIMGPDAIKKKSEEKPIENSCQVKEINTENRDQKFLKKRSVLESVLQNLKSKNSPLNEDDSKLSECNLKINIYNRTEPTKRNSNTPIIAKNRMLQMRVDNKKTKSILSPEIRKEISLKKCAGVFNQIKKIKSNNSILKAFKNTEIKNISDVKKPNVKKIYVNPNNEVKNPDLFNEINESELDYLDDVHLPIKKSKSNNSKPTANDIKVVDNKDSLKSSETKYVNNPNKTIIELLNKRPVVV